MSRLIPPAFGLSMLWAGTLMAQDATPSPAGSYVAEPVDSANAPAAFVGLTFRLVEDEWSLANDDGELVSGGYAVRADTLEMWDEAGRVACDSHVVGRYTWSLAEDALRLTLIEDQCPGRRLAMTSMRFRVRDSHD